MDKIEEYMGFLPEPFVDPVVAIITIIIGYFIAKIAQWVVAGAINRTGLGRKAKTAGGDIGKSLSKAVFWVLWLVFILFALSNFDKLSGPDGPLEPLKGMLNSVFEYLPNIFGAGFLAFIGFIVARVARQATQSSLEAAQVDSIANKLSAESDGVRTNNIAKGVASLVFAIVLLFFGAAAVDALGIESVSGPVSDMLDMILGYIPKVLGAAIILAIFVWIGRFISNLAETTLPALGFDNALKSIGGLDGETSSTTKPSKIVGVVAFVGVVLLGLTAAFNVLDIPQLTEIFSLLFEFGGQIVVGAIIIGAGLFIANFISRIVTQASGDLAGNIVKYVTILLVTFMGLSQMGIGEDIVNTAFKYSLGAVAFAVGVGGALAFGLGGRDWAKAKLAKWFPATGTRKK